MSFLSSLGKALKSRTVWVGIGTTALGGAELLAPVAPYIAPYVPAGTPVGAGITAALGIATIIGRMRAKQPIGPVIDSTIAQTLDAVHQIQGGAQSATSFPKVAPIVKATPTGELPSEQPKTIPTR